MIAFNFEYYKPTTTDEATNIYMQLKKQNKTVMYYSGGTEFISRARRNEILVDAVIDLKGIPQCNILEQTDDKIIIGSAVTLTSIQENNFFPLLTQVVRHIATRTERNKITIGGNLSSHLIYREALLPFLLANSDIEIAGKTGINTYKATQIFKNGFHLKDDEFIVSITTDNYFSTYPYVHQRKTKHSKINYPIVTLAAIKQNESINIACSGVDQFPFLLEAINLKSNVDTILTKLIEQLPYNILDDMYASKSYRTFILKNALEETLTTFEGVAE